MNALIREISQTVKYVTDKDLNSHDPASAASMA